MRIYRETKETKEYSFVFQCLSLNYTCIQTHTIIRENSKHKRTPKVTSLFDFMKFSKPTTQKESVFINLLFPTLTGCIKTLILNEIQT